MTAFFRVFDQFEGLRLADWLGFDVNLEGRLVYGYCVGKILDVLFEYFPGFSHYIFCRNWFIVILSHDSFDQVLIISFTYSLHFLYLRLLCPFGLNTNLSWSFFRNYRVFDSCIIHHDPYRYLANIFILHFNAFLALFQRQKLDFVFDTAIEFD